MTPDAGLEQYFAAEQARYIEEWSELLRFPSISTEPEHGADCVACADWLVAHIRKIGFRAESLSTSGNPVVFAERDGDPDRPVVTGSLYNGQRTPPYDLPSDKTKSTIKTKSSPDGEGYNELRFEDKKGSEEIFIHAEKDYNAVVEHDKTLEITKGDWTSELKDGNKTVTVKGDIEASAELDLTS